MSDRRAGWLTALSAVVLPVLFVLAWSATPVQAVPPGPSLAPSPTAPGPSLAPSPTAALVYDGPSASDFDATMAAAADQSKLAYVASVTAFAVLAFMAGVVVVTTALRGR